MRRVFDAVQFVVRGQIIFRISFAVIPSTLTKAILPNAAVQPEQKPGRHTVPMICHDPGLPQYVPKDSGEKRTATAISGTQTKIAAGRGSLGTYDGALTENRRNTTNPAATVPATYPPNHTEYRRQANSLMSIC